MLVWTCTTGNQDSRLTGLLTSERYPTCSDGGAWVEVQVHAIEPPPFDPVQFFFDHGSEFGFIFAAGFVTVATFHVLGMSVRALLGMLR
jgi:hypothetical protein